MRTALKVKAEGANILHNPLFNKGSAFRHGERDRLGIRGLLPSRAMTMQVSFFIFYFLFFFVFIFLYYIFLVLRWYTVYIIRCKIYFLLDIY